MRSAGWLHRTGLKLAAPAEKTSLYYSCLWMALQRTCVLRLAGQDAAHLGDGGKKTSSPVE